MKYQKIINLLDNTPNQPTKFRTRNWVKIYDDPCGIYKTTSESKFKTIMFKSSLCNYSGGYMLVKRTISVTAAAAVTANNNTRNNI